MNAPLVSVCLITYNHARHIRKAIEGVLMQQVDFPWELVIADDFSADGTREILQEYKEKHPSLIKLLLQERNVGIAQNWLEQLKFPAAKYIAHLEGDDYWLDPRKLQKQVSFLESHPDFSMSGHYVMNVDDKDKELSNKVFTGENCPEILKLENVIGGTPLHTSSFVFRREYLAEYFRFFIKDSILIGGDDALLVTLIKNGKGYCFREVMGAYRIHSGGSWSTRTAINKYFHMIKYYYSLFPYIGEQSELIKSNILKYRKAIAKAIAEENVFRNLLEYARLSLRGGLFFTNDLKVYFRVCGALAKRIWS